MSDRHEPLIQALCAGLRPVRRLPGPFARAALWLAAAAFLAALLTLPFGVAQLLARLADGWRPNVDIAAAVLTAIAAAAAALALAVPGRTSRWTLLPVLPLLLWLAATGVECWTTVITGRNLAAAPDPAGCVRFILATSLPLAALLFLMLRRGYCLHVRRATTLAGLAAAAAATALLDLHHPDALTATDFAAHLAAVAFVVALSRFALPRLLERK